MKKYRVGVIGLDHWYWADGLIPGILKHPRLKLAALYDSEPWRLAASGYAPKAERVVRTPAGITDADDIDVVVSLLPCPASARWLARAAKNRKALVCNKPLAMTVADGKRIVDALRRTGRPSFTLEGGAALSGRTALIRKIIRSGAIGRPLTAFASMRGSMPMAWRDRGGKSGRKNWGWWVDRKLVPGGAWIDHSIYAIAEFGRYLTDSPAKVAATFANISHRSSMPGLEDYGIAVYTYRRGTVVTMEYDWIGRMGSSHSIVGDRGAIRWDGGIPWGFLEVRSGRAVKKMKVPPNRENVLGHLVRCLDSGVETAHPARAGLENLRIALGAYKSARTGRTIRL